MYDVAIIGLGPAGSTLARLLSDSGLKIAAIDRKRLDGGPGFKKPCGGLLSPGAQRSLAVLGLNLPKDVLVTPQIFSVKTIDAVSGLVRHYQRCFVNVDRHLFDLWLASLIPDSVDIIDQARCRSLTFNDGCFTINFIQKHQEAHCLRARLVVGADGSASIVRRTFAPLSIRRYVCIQHHFRAETFDEPYACFFDERLTDCYGWINHKDGLKTLGMALPRQEPGRRFETAKETLRQFGYDFDRRPLAAEACLVSRPEFLHQITAGRHPGIFLAGEAAGFCSPSSLEGFSYAFDSARLLGQALARGGPDTLEYYSRSLWPLRLKIMARLFKVPFMYAPPLRRLVMKSGLDSIS